MDEIMILVGTETGSAEDVADHLAATLEELGVEPEVVDMEEAEEAHASLLDGSRAVIVCTATHGDGELPDNSWDFYEKLELEQPDLTGVLYAVCGLGDSAYPDFCEGGRIWSLLLSGLGATEVIERYERRLPRTERHRRGVRVGGMCLQAFRRTRPAKSTASTPRACWRD